MKPLSSAKTQEIILPDGRIELRVEHEMLRGVTPEMLAWWWRNIEGQMELERQLYPRYLIWHPIDHIYFRVLRRLPDGNVGVGSVFHLVEAFHAEPRYLVDAALHLRKLDETGAAVELPVLGQTALRIEGQFVKRNEGTDLKSVMTIGFSAWPGRALNGWLIERNFPADKRAAWLRHSVEEIGNFQFFLPELYRRHAPAAQPPTKGEAR